MNGASRDGRVKTGCVCIFDNIWILFNSINISFAVGHRPATMGFDGHELSTIWSIVELHNPAFYIGVMKN